MLYSNITSEEIVGITASFCCATIEHLKESPKEATERIRSEMLSNLKPGTDKYANALKRLELREKELEKRQSNTRLVFNNIQFLKNPHQFRNPHFSYYLYLYNCFEKGIQPFPGTASEQPAFYMEVIQLIGSLVSEKQEKDHEKALQESKNGRNK